MKNDDLERLEKSQDVQQLIHFAKEQYEQEKSEHTPADFSSLFVLSVFIMAEACFVSFVWEQPKRAVIDNARSKRSTEIRFIIQSSVNNFLCYIVYSVL